jgi:cephalosporin-C deacetylase
VDYSSWRKTTVHARYCRPAREGKFPGVLVSPWYSQGAIPPPTDLAKRGLAALAYQARGFEVDRSSYPKENDWYILDGIDQPEEYALRAIVCHGIRGLDVLASFPEVDATRLGVMGASQGGGLSLFIAGLDKRVAAVAADFPFMTDWPASMTEAVRAPYADIRRRLTDHPEERGATMTTLSYYDTVAVADRIAAPTLVQAGLRDGTCPSDPIKSMYGKLKSADKVWKAYRDADHSDLGDARWRTSVDFVAGVLSVR